MSNWLSHHIRSFVIPGIAALSKRNAGSLTVNDLNQDLRLGLKPAKAGYCEDAGLVLAACSSLLGPKVEFDRNVLEGLKTGADVRSARGFGISDSSNIHTMVKNSFRSVVSEAEKDNRLLVLLGRDVWVWEVMARKHGVRSFYDPRVSRLLIREIEVFDEVVKSWGIDLNKAIVFDTGFMGSIYKAVCRSSGCTPVNRMLSSSHDSQVFPKNMQARSLALEIEYLPKYFKTGTVKDGRPVQYLASLDEFIRAAAVTIWVWHAESPSWIPSDKLRMLKHKSSLLGLKFKFDGTLVPS